MRTSLEGYEPIRLLVLHIVHSSPFGPMEMSKYIYATHFLQVCVVLLAEYSTGGGANANFAGKTTRQRNKTPYSGQRHLLSHKTMSKRWNFFHTHTLRKYTYNVSYIYHNIKQDVTHSSCKCVFRVWHDITYNWVILCSTQELYERIKAARVLGCI